MDEEISVIIYDKQIKFTKQGGKMKKLKLLAAVGFGAVSLAGLAGSAVYAANTANSTLTQTINAGALSTDIRNSSNAVVSNPTFAMGAVTLSTSAQTSTGTFGENDKRISVDNPGGANNGWTLTLNATTPGTGKWTDGGKSYKYNGTAADGRLTVDPSTGTVTPVIGTATGITKGSSMAFSGSNPVTLMSASAGADVVWNGYITGVSLKQDIPAGQQAGTYTLPMTQTVAAI